MTSPSQCPHKPSTVNWLRIALMLCLGLLLPQLLTAQEQHENAFLNLSIEELGQLDVTSATGVEEQWFRAPAAIYVITPEDIQRTGHQTLPELLRLVPGLDVAHATSNQWSIGARGIKGNYGDSLLMLIDGRSLYDPLLGYIRWNTQDLVLNDIKNIEVIRGPGATLWGSKAVNGVINVTTKSARDTQGWYLSGIGGNKQRANISARYGGQIDDNTYFKIWTKYANHGPSKKINGQDHYDDWDYYSSGFRIDTEAPDNLTWALHGGFGFSDQLGGMSTEPAPNTHFGVNSIIGDNQSLNYFLHATLKKQVSDQNKWNASASYQHSTEKIRTDLKLLRDTFDLDYRHRYATSDTQLFVWGASARMSTDHTYQSTYAEYIPDEELTYNFSSFLQSSTTFFDDHVSVILGSKFEYNNYSGFEIQPSIRATWTPDSNNTIWGAVSRAVRTPSRSSVDARSTAFFVDPSLLLGGPPSGFYLPAVIAANGDVESEKLVSYELGYRSRLPGNLTLDLATYFNHYTDLVSISNTFDINNNLAGEVFGGEINLVWTPAPTLRVEAGYSYAKTSMHGDLSDEVQASYPENHFHLRSYLDINQDLECNAALYYTGENRTFSADPYLRLDIGMTWRLNANTSLSLWGQNLLDNQHPELIDVFQMPEPTEVPRSLYLQLNMTF